MEKSPEHPPSPAKPSWRGALLTQVLLLIGLYGAFSIGTPQDSWNPGLSRRTRRSKSLDFYFLSVRGGFWPAEEQTQLLKQMEKTAEFHEAKFVVNISELREDDPLMQNATLYFPILKIPWYTTMAGNGAVTLCGKSNECFLKKINIAYDKILDIIGLDTGLLQEFSGLERLKESGSDQLHWLQQILSVTDSKWRMAVGFHPLTICRKQAQNSVEFYQPLHKIFLKHGVNAYLSQQGCAGQPYNIGGIAYLGNPGPSDHGQKPSSENTKVNVVSETSVGFLLHRVTPLEIESYFINSAGRIVSISKIYQHGRRAM